MAQGSNLEFLDIGADARRENRVKAVEFASLYVSAFVNNPAGAQLLRHWTETLARKRTPVNATIQEYAANEANRAFVESIHDQIRLAKEGLSTE